MPISYSIKIRKRSRRVSIFVLADGRVVVSAPKRIGKKQIAAIVAHHEEWIARSINKSQKRMEGSRVENDDFDRNEFVGNVRKLAAEWRDKVAARYDINFGKVTVKTMRSRWGSCSRQGNISVNLLLGHLPARSLEYVIAHEACHLVHHNHSQAFWSLLGKFMPDHRARRNELRRYGYLLSSIKPF